ncbi:unnamed protein product, partial [Pylaiella littoralis]
MLLAVARPLGGGGAAGAGVIPPAAPGVLASGGLLPPPPPPASPLPPPPSPPKPTREKEPNYDKDWLLAACTRETRRRANMAGDSKFFRYGDDEDDVQTSIPSMKKGAAAQALLAHDAWLE